LSSKDLRQQVNVSVLRNKSTFVVTNSILSQEVSITQEKKVLRAETSVFKRVGEKHNILISQNNQAILRSPQHGGNLL
jgi:hypothetical protein